MANEVLVPFPMFFDADGSPLDRGYIYIGIAGLNPLANPQNAYWDEDLTIPAYKVRTTQGYVLYNGGPGRLYTANDYSILVTDKNGKIVFSCLTMLAVASSMLMVRPRGNLTRAMLTPDTYNLNLILESGFYAWINNGASNIPAGCATNDSFELDVLSSPDGSGLVRQTLYDLTNGPAVLAYAFGRQSLDAGATWTAWLGLPTRNGVRNVGLDADTVSGYGIGVNNSPQMVGSFDNYKATGNFYDPGSLMNGPNGTGCSSVLVLAEQNNSWVHQLAFCRFASDATIIKVRHFYSGTTWSAWHTLWDSSNDGPGSGLDADMVSGYGIGTVAKSITGAVTMDTAFSGGGLYVSNTITDSPSPGNWFIYEVAYTGAATKVVKAYYQDGSGLCVVNVKATIWTGWKKISGNASTATLFDADTVSGHGIGASTLLTGIDLDQVRLGGTSATSIGSLLSIDASCTHTPTGVFGFMLTISRDINNAIQVYWEHGASPHQMYWRSWTGSWGAWDKNWTAASDGNGGQPPAPKPSSNGPAYNATITIPAGSNTGTWYIATSGGAVAVALPAISGVQAGTRITIKKYQSDANAVTINRAGSDVIGGYAGTSFVLYAMEDYVTLENTGTSWFVVATNGPVVKSDQTANVATSTTGAWTAVGSGLTLGTLAPGVYDVELDCMVYAAGTKICSAAIGNGTTPISNTSGVDSTVSGVTVNAPCHVIAKGYVLTAPATIQAIYKSNYAANYISYHSDQVAKITARRIG